MIRRYALAFIALLGLAIAVITVHYSDQKPTTSTSILALPEVSYSSYIAANGLIEAKSGDIAIGSTVPGVIHEIFVKVGDHVNSGDLLFKIDDRAIQAKLLAASGKVDEAQANLLKPKHQLAFAVNLSKRDEGALSEQSLSDLRDEVASREASLTSAVAEVKALKLQLQLYSINAPITAQVLQIAARSGEYTPGGDVHGLPIMLLGTNAQLNVRVYIDENDAWRFKPTANATAFLRSNPNIHSELEFSYLEPHVVPKQTLSGQPTERTDARVLEVLYGVRNPDFPVYIGQQIDVFIEAPGSESGTGELTQSGVN